RSGTRTTYALCTPRWLAFPRCQKNCSYRFRRSQNSKIPWERSSKKWKTFTFHVANKGTSKAGTIGKPVEISLCRPKPLKCLRRFFPSHGRGPRFDPLCVHHATFRPSDMEVPDHQ